jgi:hypothetical protein
MSFTIDFLLLVLMIVIPGLLFKRFYFLGEFSKQFSTKDSVYKSVFYSIIPGILIQLLAYIIYISARVPDFSNEDIICVFKEFLSSQDSYSNTTKDFIQKGLLYFAIHQINVFFLAGVSGYTFYLLIRLTKLDVRAKILRFKNQWYYIFSGEFKSFKKIERAHILLSNLEEIKLPSDNEYQFFPPKADVLIKGDSAIPQLYSGFIIDYDLNSDNINDLDKLYLFKAYRYREKRRGDIKKGYQILGSRTKIPITGDVFILKAKDIISLNLTFIPLYSKESKKKDNKNIFKNIYFSGMLINFIVLIYLLLINTSLVKDILPRVTELITDYNWFHRLSIAIIITSLISIFLPEEIIKDNKEEETKHQYSKPDVKNKIGLFVVFLLVYISIRHFFID